MKSTTATADGRRVANSVWRSPMGMGRFTALPLWDGRSPGIWMTDDRRGDTALHRRYSQWMQLPLWLLCPNCQRDGVSEDHHLHAGGGKRGQPAGLRVVVRTGIPGRWKLECAGAPTGGEPEHRPKTNVLQGIEVKQVVFDLTMLWNALWPGSVLFTGRTSPAAHFRQQPKPC